MSIIFIRTNFSEFAYYDIEDINMSLIYKMEVIKGGRNYK